MTSKKIFLFAAILVIVGSFALGFASRNFSGSLAEVVKFAVADPTNLTATSAGPKTSVSLNWKDNSNNEQFFSVERSGPTTSSSFSELVRVGANVTSTSDPFPSSTTPGMYYYRVVALANASGTVGSHYSNTVNIFRGIAPIAPPSDLYASSTATTTYMSWRDNSDNEISFLVERSADGSSFSPIGSVGAHTGDNVVPYTDTSTLSAGTYYYRVTAISFQGVSSTYSNVVSTVRPSPDLAAPSNLLGTGGTNSIGLSWTDNSSNEGGFSIERGYSTSSFSFIGTVGQNVTSYNDSTPITAGVYYYRVRAYSGSSSSTSVYSNVAWAMRGIAAPSNLSTVATNTITVFLQWDDNANNETEFRIERSGPNVSSSFLTITSTTPNRSYYTDFLGITTGTYFYRVRAISGMVSSTYSNISSITK